MLAVVIILSAISSVCGAGYRARLVEYRALLKGYRALLVEHRALLVEYRALLVEHRDLLIGFSSVRGTSRRLSTQDVNRRLESRVYPIGLF